MYNRLERWDAFDEQVRRHIQQYTVPQYDDDGGNGQIDNFSTEDCFKAMERYFHRRHARVRGNKEALRDLLKIAHYAQFAYQRLRADLGEDDVYG